MDTNILSKKLKEYRKTNNFTQEDLANLLHVSRKTISKWETSRGIPEVYMLASIAKLLDITIDELFKTISSNSNEVNEKYLEDKKVYLIWNVIIDMVFLLFIVLGDIPVLINNSLKSISMIIGVIVLIFVIIFKVLNYYTNAYQNKRKDLSRYYFTYHMINKSFISVSIIEVFVIIFKCVYLLNSNNDIRIASGLIVVILCIMIVLIVYTRIKEIIRNVESRKN